MEAMTEQKEPAREKDSRQQKRSVVNVRRYNRVVSFFESTTERDSRSVVNVRRYNRVVSFFESTTDP